MNQSKKLASHLAFALSFATLVGSSAFADNRHSQETHSRSERHSDRGSFDRSSRSSDRSFNRDTSRSWDRSGSTRSNDRGFNRDNNRSFENRSERNFDRNNNDRNRNFSRNDNRSYSRNDNRSFNRDNRSYNNRNFDHGRSFERGRPFFHEGRVTRYERFGSGYRVWLGGFGYPFFIPEARFRLFPRFYIGLNIRLGGYYNPLGYYDYYDDAYYGGPQLYSATAGELRGIVESVDYRRGTILIHDSVSNRFVTAEMRGGDRRFDDLRIGDYVVLSGDWTRIGVFEAYGVPVLDPAGYRYR